MQRPLYAVLIDGGFLTKKLQQRYSRPVTAEDIVLECDVLRQNELVSNYELLRIYYYDAVPASGQVKKPVSGNLLNLSKTDRYRQAQSLYDQLILKPQFALRMGEVIISPEKWRVKPHSVRKILKDNRPFNDDDFILDASQKGVDMRIGMDMARLALREMVRAVIVVTGDSDFVPAFKFVRREGVKVILQPYGHNVRIELKQHSDFVLDAPISPPN